MVQSNFVMKQCNNNNGKRQDNLWNTISLKHELPFLPWLSLGSVVGVLCLLFVLITGLYFRGRGRDDGLKEEKFSCKTTHTETKTMPTLTL